MHLYGNIATTDGTSKNNATTGTPFAMPSRVTVQPNVDVYLNQGNSSVTATSTGAKVPADALVDIDLVYGNTHIAMVPVSASGAATVKVFISRPVG